MESNSNNRVHQTLCCSLSDINRYDSNVAKHFTIVILILPK